MDALRPHLARATLYHDDVLYEPGRPVEHVYFPTSCFVSLLRSTRECAFVEIGVVGTDGIVGIAPLLDASSPAHHAIVQIAGEALRIDAGVLRHRIEVSPRLRRAVSRYTHVLMTQFAQVAVCNTVHTLQQRLCRWLLVCRDRLGSIDIPATQDALARLLAVRRESVSHAAGMLQTEGVLHYVRGRLQIVDAARLEARVCECHGVISSAHAGMLETAT